MLSAVRGLIRRRVVIAKSDLLKSIDLCDMKGNLWEHCNVLEFRSCDPTKQHHLARAFHRGARALVSGPDANPRWSVLGPRR